jgi:L-aminopeptidase/D-esterase-like protein
VYIQVRDTKVCVFTVVNSIGAIVNRKGEVIRGFYDPDTRARYHGTSATATKYSGVSSRDLRGKNTTLTIVITNQKFEMPSLQQLSKQIHTSMARAIHPFHTIYDGDVLYLVTTNEVENRDLNDVEFGIIASEVAWDAVLSIAG